MQISVRVAGGAELIGVSDHRSDVLDPVGLVAFALSHERPEEPPSGRIPLALDHSEGPPISPVARARPNDCLQSVLRDPGSATRRRRRADAEGRRRGGVRLGGTPLIHSHRVALDDPIGLCRVQPAGERDGLVRQSALRGFIEREAEVDEA